MSNITSTGPASKPAPDPALPLERLKAFNTAVQKRFSEVEDQFLTSTLDPTESKDFKKFISDTLAQANSWYVVTGQFKDFISPDSDNPVAERNAKMTESGFAVSSTGKKVELDPMMAGSAAAIAAAQDGAFDGDDDEEFERTQVKPERPK